MTTPGFYDPFSGRPEQPLSPEQLAAYTTAFDGALTAAALPEQACQPGAVHLTLERWGDQYDPRRDTGYQVSKEPDGTTKTTFLFHGDETDDRALVLLELDSLRSEPAKLGRFLAQFEASHPRTGAVVSVSLQRLSSVDLQGHIVSSDYTMTVSHVDDPGGPWTNFFANQDQEPSLISRGGAPGSDGARPVLDRPDLSVAELTALLDGAKELSPNQ